MDFFKKALEWLNGNKTFFGMFILLFLQQGFISETTFAYEFLQWIGGLLSVGGMAHKIKKATTKK